MGLEDNKTLVCTFLEAINAQEWDRLDNLVADGVVRHSSMPGQPTLRSRSELLAFLHREAETFPDAHESVQFLVAEGDKVAARLGFRGTQQGPLGPFPPSGRTLTADFLAIFRVEEGKIAEVWVEWDNLASLIRLGHYTPPTAPQ